MIAPVWLKPAACALALVGAFTAGWTAQGWRADARLSKLQQAHAKEQAAQQTQALADYQRMEQTKNDAIQKAQARSEYLQTVAGAAAAAADSLRKQLAGVPARIATASRAAVDEYAATAGELLGACTAEYRAVAAAADGHAADVRTLTAAWPVMTTPTGR